MTVTVYEAMLRYQHATLEWCKASTERCEAATEFYDQALGLYRYDLVEALLTAVPPMSEEGAHLVVDNFSDWIIEQFQANIQTTIGNYVVVM
jgi:hypothetical protein